MPPLPHHRAYGSVPRRFDWVKLGQRNANLELTRFAKQGKRYLSFTQAVETDRHSWASWMATR
jgi:hypothetical protein